MRTHQEDNKIMTLLKVSEISRIICDTDKGTLKLRIRKGETSYHFVLDAVELDKELNKELMEVLYPPKVEVGSGGYGILSAGGIVTGGTFLNKKVTEATQNYLNQELVNTLIPKNKGGRPKGSKNKR